MPFITEAGERRHKKFKVVGEARPALIHGQLRLRRDPMGVGEVGMSRTERTQTSLKIGWLFLTGESVVPWHRR